MSAQAPTEAPGDPAVYELAFTEAVRGIEAQSRAVEELRSRCGIVLSAGSLVAGFLGPSALDGGLSPGAVVAGLLLLACVVPAIFVLLPAEWIFLFGPKAIVRDYIEADPPATMAELHRSLALYLEENWDKNRVQLDRRQTWFSVSAGAVVFETLALLATIAAKGT